MDKVDLKTRLGRKTSADPFMRWIFFCTAVIGCLILTSFTERPFQVIGWGISSISCLGWVVIAIQDKDTPRMLMEIMYAAMGAWGFINWLSL